MNSRPTSFEVVYDEGKMKSEGESNKTRVAVRGCRTQLAKRRAIAVVITIAVIGSLMWAAAAINRAARAAVRPTKTERAVTPSGAQGVSTKSRSLLSKLSFQPEPNKIRRQLGQRFQSPGRETAVRVGTLTIGGQTQPIRIVRTQDEQDGEQVMITLNNNQKALTWNPREGAQSAGAPPQAAERGAIERLALDSPDQFILAQTRGASYFTIARSVRPEEAGDAESYSGPVWDLVRVAEPEDGTTSKPINLWRIYYVNSATGLIDRIFYDDQGQSVTVEFLGWANLEGEMEPSLIRWTRGGQVTMELSLTNVSYESK